MKDLIEKKRMLKIWFELVQPFLSYGLLKFTKRMSLLPFHIWYSVLYCISTRFIELHKFFKLKTCHSIYQNKGYVTRIALEVKLF